jgi:hypothetical protein
MVALQIGQSGKGIIEALCAAEAKGCEKAVAF